MFNRIFLTVLVYLTVCCNSVFCMHGLNDDLRNRPNREMRDGVNRQMGQLNRNLDMGNQPAINDIFAVQQAIFPGNQNAIGVEILSSLLSLGIKVGAVLFVNYLLNKSSYYNKNINPFMKKCCKYVGRSKLFWGGAFFLFTYPFFGLMQGHIDVLL